MRCKEVARGGGYGGRVAGEGVRRGVVWRGYADIGTPPATVNNRLTIFFVGGVFGVLVLVLIFFFTEDQFALIF